MSKTSDEDNRAALKEELDLRERQMRSSVRWLFEARRFKADFGQEKWKPGKEGEIAEIAAVTYAEAAADVVIARKNLELARKAYFKKRTIR
jgi:hypothetical protein